MRLLAEGSLGTWYGNLPLWLAVAEVVFAKYVLPPAIANALTRKILPVLMVPSDLDFWLTVIMKIAWLRELSSFMPVALTWNGL